MSKTDNHTPGNKWEFTEDVSACFEDMLSRSIPDYAGMRESVFDIGSRFVQRGSSILDMGCSIGEGLKPFIARFGDANRYIGVDNAVSMIQRAEVNVARNSGIVDLQQWDLRTGLPDADCSLILCVLTLQFVPITYRQVLLRQAWERLRIGGALVLVEKVLGQTDNTETILVETYHEHKRRNGYSHEQVERKRESLENVLVTLKASWNEELLRNAGFTSVECFWRRLSFAGWVAVK